MSWIFIGTKKTETNEKRESNAPIKMSLARGNERET